MAESIPPDSGLARTSRPHRLLGRLASLALVLEIALALRVAAADAVEWYARRGGQARLDLFPDTDIYWELARAIRAGGPYEYVEWGDIPHFAIRTPGYPLLLAACQAIFGERTLPVRLVQAALGTLCVYLVYHIARQLILTDRDRAADAAASGARPGGGSGGGEVSPQRRWTVPLIAAAIAAVNPHYLVMSSLVLSEAVFEPLMLAALLGVAVLWPRSRDAGGPDPIAGWRFLAIALGSGAAAGAAVLVRPSWALFVPAMLAAWFIASLLAGQGRAAARGAILCAVGLVLIMAPWWVRNARIYGRFVPTALWLGASLYDGISPRATGASDMIPFLRDPEIWPLDEQDQDAELTRRAIAFARDNPGRVLELALVKLGRYWSPWPNAVGFRSWGVAVAGAVVEVPILGLMALGLWDRRRDPRAWVLLAGPILYFCALHAVFASSMRYRIPGEMPALGLAAIGCLSAGRGSLRVG
jgi:4-amino-4-deoxy-L-arabinose transferase-like glycosyltransferase